MSPAFSGCARVSGRRRRHSGRLSEVSDLSRSSNSGVLLAWWAMVTPGS